MLKKFRDTNIPDRADLYAERKSTPASFSWFINSIYLSISESMTGRLRALSANRCKHSDISSMSSSLLGKIPNLFLRVTSVVIGPSTSTQSISRVGTTGTPCSSTIFVLSDLNPPFNDASFWPASMIPCLNLITPPLACFFV